jgi:membrane fusion protein, heavy metal efflux system
MRHAIVAAVALGLALASGACRGAERDANASTVPAPPPSQHTSRGVRLDPAQLKQVRIEQIGTYAGADVIHATGTVEFNGDRMSRIVPPVAGQVHDLAVNVGDVVRSGDVLFVLRSREVAAAIADHLASHNDLELAEKTSAMTEDLFDHQAASRISLQQAENELGKARAKVAQTEEALRVLGIDARAAEDLTRLQSQVPVRAPLGGTVIERSVTAGQFVGPETGPLVVVADLSTVWVQAEVFERDLGKIKIGQHADVTTTAYPDERFTAQISRIGSVVDAQTHTAKVRFLVANRDARLKPGMFTSATLYLPASTAWLRIPAKAVFVENGRSFAYVQSGPGQFVRREIATGTAIDADQLRVERGVIAGDRVVSDGVLLLRQLEVDSPSEAHDQ